MRKSIFVIVRAIFRKCFTVMYHHRANLSLYAWDEWFGDLLPISVVHLAANKIWEMIRHYLFSERFTTSANLCEVWYLWYHQNQTGIPNDPFRFTQGRTAQLSRWFGGRNIRILKLSLHYFLENASSTYLVRLIKHAHGMSNLGYGIIEWFWLCNGRIIITFALWNRSIRISPNQSQDRIKYTVHDT